MTNEPLEFRPDHEGRTQPAVGSEMTNEAAKGWQKLSDEDFLARIQANRRARMERIDGFPPELREMVNAYGLRVVDTCMALGVTKPRQIRHIVETVLDEFSPTRGSHSKQGIRTEVSQPEKSQ